MVFDQIALAVTVSNHRALRCWSMNVPHAFPTVPPTSVTRSATAVMIATSAWDTDAWGSHDVLPNPMLKWTEGARRMKGRVWAGWNKQRALQSAEMRIWVREGH